jgi:hypothetical protein
LREEHGLRVLRTGTWAEGVENRALRRIFGPERNEVTGEWRQLHNDKLNDLYSSNIWVIKLIRMRWGGHVTRVGRAEHKEVWWGNRPLGRPRHRWHDKIRMHLNL